MSAAATTVIPARNSSVLPSVTVGLVIGFNNILYAISLASLVFTGPLQSSLPRGIGIALFTGIINCLFTAAFTWKDGIFYSLQDNPAVLMGVAAGAIGGTIAAGPQLTATVIALMMVTTLLTGVFLMLIGRFGLGRLVRFIPYPVIGGFLAGVGWLIAQGSIPAMSGLSLRLDTLPTLVHPDQIPLWLPGVLIGLALFFGVRRFKHYLVTPAILFGSVVLFYAVLGISGLSVDQAMERGLLLGHVSAHAVWQPLPLNDLVQADWRAILGQAGSIGTILILVPIALLLNVSGLELTLRSDIDLNRELRLAGLRNVLSGLGGGIISYPDMSASTLMKLVGARGRLPSLISGGLLLVVLVIGGSFLAYIPKAIFGGLLLFLGLDFLDTWVVRGRHSMSRADYSVVLLILVIVATSGFLVGVGVGLVMMVGLFVVNYSRLNLFRRAFSGAELTSQVERSIEQRQALAELGKRVFVLELQGFIFFGTANTLLERVRERIEDSRQPRLNSLILDFRRVTGLDSSAGLSLVKMKNLSEKHDFALILTDLTPKAQAELERGDLKASGRVVYLPDLDHGLEWCEDTLLSYSEVTRKRQAYSLTEQLLSLGLKHDQAVQFRSYLEALTFEDGDYLIRQGEDASTLFFIEAGQVSLYLELENRERVRLREVDIGTIVGEIGFYTSAPRTASVIADLPTQAYRLTREAMARMQAEAPQLAIAFDHGMLRVFSERLILTTRQLAAANQ